MQEAPAAQWFCAGFTPAEGLEWAEIVHGHTNIFLEINI